MTKLRAMLASSALIIASTSLVFSQEMKLELPDVGELEVDSFNQRSETANKKIESYSSLDYLSIGNFDSIIVEYSSSMKNPFADGQNIAAAATLGITATKITPETYELQISSQPILASEFDTDNSALIKRRAEILANILDSDESVVDWFPNYNVTKQAISDPFYEKQWHYFPNGSFEDGKFPGGTDISELWSFSPGSSDVVVAVLDTGFLFDHEDAANVIDGFDFVSDLDASNDGDGWDSNAQDPGDACGPLNTNSWHGSHVAGTIGALGHNGLGGVGINKNVSIIPVRVLGKCGGNFNDILTAVLWAADLLDSQSLIELGLPRVSKKANIINMSLGGLGRCQRGAANIFQRVAESGTLVVVAAGNDARNASDFVPASCPGVMTVAASDMSGSLVGRYSNFGPLVSIMAPGGDIKSDLDGNGFPDGVFSMIKDDYAFFNGTSMAAPHVAGLAAHIYALNPDLSPSQVANLMIKFGLQRNSEQCPRNCGPLLNARFLLPN